MINMFISNDMYLSFCSFMSCPEHPMGIYGVGPFSMQVGGSLIPFFKSCQMLEVNFK